MLREGVTDVGVADVLGRWVVGFWVQARLSHCLSSPLVRRWCRAEWMYSALDLPWFARNEFTDYLRHLRLHHISALTRAEWGSIRRWGVEERD